MKFNTTKFKLNNIFNTIESNKNKLSETNNELSFLPLDSESIKITNIIYDSGWIKALPLIDTIIPPGVDPNASVLASTIGIYGTTKHNSLYPSRIDYSFSQILDISESYLPYVNIDILVKSFPSVEIMKGQYFSDYELWGEDYYILKGDGKILYQGESPPNNNSDSYTTDEINSGITDWDLTSKWFEGEIFYSDGTFDYKMIGKIDYIESYYNVTYIPDADEYNYESFKAIALNSVSNSSFNGTGTYIKKEWIYNSEAGYWELNTTQTKNTTLTVSYKQNTTTISSFGLRYKNIGGEWQLIGSGAYYIVNHGDFDTSPNKTIGLVNVDYLQNNRIFYSDKRANLLLVNIGTETFISTPNKSDYQSGTLPYTHLTFEINNSSNYPLSESAFTPQNAFFAKTIRYIKINENSYKIKVDGSIFYKSPANQPRTQEFDTINETYSQTLTSYIRDAINRGTKNKNIYFPELLPVEVKLLLTAKNLKNNISISKYEK